MSTSAIELLIKAFYCELEILLNDYEELLDTDVRESLHIALTYYFIWGNKANDFPVNYGMFSKDGDKAVSELVEKTITSINSSDEIASLPVGRERLDMLQNEMLVTPKGRKYYDFLGIRKEPLKADKLPDYMFEDGNYE